VLALAVGLLATVGACTGSVQAPPTKTAAARAASPAPAAPAPALTRSEAAKAFNTVLVTDDALRVPSEVPGRLRLARELTTGGQTPLLQAAYLSTGNRPPRYTWGLPALLVPRFAQGSALWFSALVTRNGRSTLLTFTKGEIWQLSSAAQLLPGQTLPDVRLDADGYATAVAIDDKTITISPQYMGPVHASVAETGAAGVTAGLIADGPYTTGVAEQIATVREQSKVAGFSYDSIFSADNWPVYSLRTEDGGALIQYSLSRNTTTKTIANETYKIPVPAAAAWTMPDRPTTPLSLKLTEIHQYAAVVPPLTAPAAARVIAHDGALTGAMGT
jgi:hypothetical protein